MMASGSAGRANLWPAGVATSADMYKFCRMMVGKSAEIVDYGDRLPYPTEDSFCFFIPGGCAAGTLLHGLRDCVPAMLLEIESKEIRRGNSSNPSKAYAVRDKTTKKVFYETSQLSSKRCGCRTAFGGDSGHNGVSVDSQQWVAGTMYENVLMEVIRQNTVNQLETVYALKAFHALLNVNHHKQVHGIDAHSDVQPGSTYVPTDPITSCSWGRPGVLVLSVAPNTGHKYVTKQTMLVARDGDVTIMGGDFQRRFRHEVPPVPLWQDLQASLSADLEPWEIEAIDQETTLFATGYPEVSDTRLNSTIRWHTNHHRGCNWNPKKCSAPPESSASSQQATVDTSPRLL